MPKTEIDYSNTIIYKVTCKDPNVKDLYVGHTTNFVQRKYSHKKNCANEKSSQYNCKLYKVIRENGGWSNWNIEILEFLNCSDHYAAINREKTYFESLNATLNRNDSIQKFNSKKKQKNNAEKMENKCFYDNSLSSDLNLSVQKTCDQNGESIFSNKKMPKNAGFYECENCDFVCSKLSNYNTHILTRKHKLAIFSNKKMPKNAESIKNVICEYCGREYKDNSGLWRHKKNCEQNKNNEKDAYVIDDENDIVMLLLKENKEFKQLIVEQNKQTNEIQKQMIELAKKPTTINNNCTNKNKFNINFFLNEKCKDAMNINDFVNSLKLTLQDLEKTGEIGYVKGITNIIVNGLNELDVYKRPIHCSDVKRETIYIKDNDAWEKENEEKKKLTKAIKHISVRNAKQVGEWARENKGYDDSANKKSDKYLKIISQANGGEPEEINKIISNITSKITIDKQI